MNYLKILAARDTLMENYFGFEGDDEIEELTEGEESSNFDDDIDENDEEDFSIDNTDTVVPEFDNRKESNQKIKEKDIVPFNNLKI